jgi:hypothetical protein
MNCSILLEKEVEEEEQKEENYEGSQLGEQASFHNCNYTCTSDSQIL